MPLAAPATAGGTRPGQREHGATILRQGQHRSESLRGYRPALCLDYWWEVRNHRQYRPRLTRDGAVLFAALAEGNDLRQIAVELDRERAACRRQLDALDERA